MNYLNALIEKNEQKKIAELEKIILLGEQLNKDVTPDRKKLAILQKRNTKNDDVYSAKSESSKQNEPTNTGTNTSSSSNDLYYSIKSVYTSGNTIIVDFNVDINEKDIKFFELNQKTANKDVYDIKGFFKDAAPTKLGINGVERIAIGQFKPDVLRIVLSDKRNLNTSYIVNKKQIIISLNESTAKVKEPAVTKTYTEPSAPKEQVVQTSSQEFVDTTNPIRSMETQGNKIIVKFNKNYYKRDLQFVRYKNASNYENVFNLNGKYKFVNPIKLSIDGVDKIVVSENGKNGVKVRIINNYEQKVDYVLNDKELTITTYPTGPSNTSSDKSTAVAKAKTPPPPQPRVINKTVVIDPGHGAEDAGAVGPNKRYEKVINLNVAKNLYSLLKQRGYKVYLTRDNDTFIKVMNRTVLANDKNADIFISIHTNSVPKEKANEVTGIETFFLSPARNERAKRVAAIENKSDIREMSNSSKDVFLESLNRPRITASHKLAIDVQAGLLQSSRSKYKDVKDSGVREGPFWVLVGAQMPSILVELGYVSHPTESKRLYDKSYQQLLANGIANGIDSYFSKNP
jgi:N-acetylmuramoyl-L-alanine amidase